MWENGCAAATEVGQRACAGRCLSGADIPEARAWPLDMAGQGQQWPVLIT